MSTASIFYRGNTAIVRIRGLRDANRNYLDDATVLMVSLVDESTGEAVDGVSTPVDMEYVADSDGVYEGVIPHNADVTVGHRYIATVRAESTGGHRGEWEELIRVRTRRG